ncbi:MAG TPA: hypothetical protein VN673_08330 [Clostridia bacterium]|nr:hypothetical protein [Clostridia bacterium]
MNALIRRNLSALSITLCLLTGSVTLGQSTDQLVGIWTVDEGYQIVEYLFRSDGRYQIDTRSTEPPFDFSFTDRGRYTASGQALALVPYDYLSEPQTNYFEFEVNGDVLALTRLDIFQTQFYQYKAGSREDVLAREAVDPVLIRTWERTIIFYGKEAYTFRPGGYYFVKSTPDDSEFPPEFIRGRYQQSGDMVTIHPYSGIPVQYEADFFGDTLTLITSDGQSTSFVEVPGSAAEVAAKSAEAEAFLNSTNWQVGVWEVRDGYQTVDLTIRPDGHYVATNATELLRGIVRGRYTLDLEPRRIHLFPFVGQGLYSRDNGEFGKVDRTRELDYYDGELQFIDLESISQWVTIAHKRPGSQTIVLDKTQQAQAERAQPNWQVGIWEVNDPTGWMEFTFRPDHRYIAKSGTGGVPSQVERGRFLFAADKVTLAPYSGLTPARGFELDLYDGDLFLVGDWTRMVVARKTPGSAAEVTDKTINPNSTKGERGAILGRWTANMPGQFAELVFRQDGQFRLSRCVNNVISQDYGLYSADMATRALVYDSRFVPVRTQGLDFYGDTLTIYGGVLAYPSTYTVNLGTVDASIAASLAADAAEALVDAQWMARVPVAPREPDAVQVPVGDIPADPNPTHIFQSPTVFTNYQFYRRLIGTTVLFFDQGTIKSVPVINTREWHLFPTGRVLVRFRNHRASASYPITIVDVTDNWGAYRVDPKPTQLDILHIFADNSLFIESDLGEQVEMTLEDGRRHLFWGKDFQLLSTWAAEQQPTPCQPPANPDPSLINTDIALTTDIAPDEIPDSRAPTLYLTGPVSGSFTLSGTNGNASELVVERAIRLGLPIVWEPVQTNNVPAGVFNFLIPQGTNAAAYFRLLVR